MISDDVKEAIRVMQEGIAASKTEDAVLSDIGIAFAVIAVANGMDPVDAMRTTVHAIRVAVSALPEEIARA